MHFDSKVTGPAKHLERFCSQQQQGFDTSGLSSRDARALTIHLLTICSYRRPIPTHSYHHRILTSLCHNILTPPPHSHLITTHPSPYQDHQSPPPSSSPQNPSTPVPPSFPHFYYHPLITSVHLRRQTPLYLLRQIPQLPLHIRRYHDSFRSNRRVLWIRATKHFCA
jgi:hypothetical protein